MKLPAFTVPILSILQPAFSTPTYHRFLVLLLGAILTTGRRTITNICRSVRPYTQGHVSSYHRVLSQRRWSPWELARRLLIFGSNRNGIKLASEPLLDYLLAQFLPGFNHQREALGSPLLDPRLHPMGAFRVYNQCHE
jgi:hypothetical protein